MAISNLTFPVRSATPTFDWTGNDLAGNPQSIPVEIIISPRQDGTSQLTLLYTSGGRQRGIVMDYALPAVPVSGTGTAAQTAVRTLIGALIEAVMPIATGVDAV